MKKTLVWLWIIMLTTSIASCSSFPSSSQHATPAPLYDIDGFWTGFTQERGAVYFTIEDRKLIFASVSILQQSTCSNWYGSYDSFPKVAISGNEFIADVASRDVKATFHSVYTATGTIQQIESIFARCTKSRDLQWLAYKHSVPDKNACQVITLEDMTTRYVTQEPSLAPEVNCFISEGQAYLKHPQGAILIPAAYDVWFPDRRVVNFEGAHSSVISIGGITLSYLDVDTDVLIESSTNTPVAEWSEKDSAYIALINFYEEIR